jgi:phage recombination protein Bet
MTNTTALRPVPESSAPAAITQYHPDQIRLLKEHIAPGCTDSELQYYVEVAKSAGLNPLRKEIYAIRRKTWDAVRREEVWKVSFQVAIDGFRKIAHATGEFLGCSDAVFSTEPAFNGQGHDLVCTMTVTRRVGEEVGQWTASARWSEYVQRKQSGDPVHMWAKMPKAMLAKCTEALALRKAFPNELAGLYSNDEMAQADVGPGPEVIDTTAEPIEPPPAERDPVKHLQDWWFAVCGDLYRSKRLPFDVRKLPTPARHHVQLYVLGANSLSLLPPDAARRILGDNVLPHPEDEEGKARLRNAIISAYEDYEDAQRGQA